jgi:hypothetical protein
MTLSNYYALWYFTLNGEKSANAISKDKDYLWELHKKSISNPDCYYHKYKKSIFKVEVLPIQYFIYKEEEEEEKEEEKEEDFELYCSYNIYFKEINLNINNNIELEEILIFMSKEDHEKCRTKNEISISINPVKLNEYYEEGIMNA